ncbi:hypothetical protein K493DRAFT_280209 [Basidiobolus meristosporus CBS 931.73]|uniref:RFX1-4/6/8-like BCD domain-containing protein n=1 Tax=Basidiobolus meristosporus CBS 931.73 TaxID=1314790 RepID=A0A1Y1YLY7_9FUNG|nr:hypothetical protein K493DRAFT_280209 [Basidiobolus meristosporus CBS 931.73]|eukprot:ORX98853.1 hypothetical protein K493DRAFT_280209 [Basidiobolus meristosporus CBS 931.73]
MALDWADVDFHSLRDQAYVICHCTKADLVQICMLQVHPLDPTSSTNLGCEPVEIDIKQLLETSAPLEQWVCWIEKIYGRYVGENSSIDGIGNIQSFVMKWSYFGSLVVRDLSIRSAQSFGEFTTASLEIGWGWGLTANHPFKPMFRILSNPAAVY